MPGDNVRKEPTLEEQIGKFQSFATQDGEVADPAKENLNPTTTGLSPEEIAAGATLIEEQPVELAAEGADGEKTGDKAGEKKAGTEKTGDKKDAAVPPAVQKRINAAVRAQRAAERERDAQAGELRQMKERLERLESGSLTPKGQGDTAEDDPNAPKATAYEYGELDPKYTRDLARYEAKKVLEAERKQARATADSSAQSAVQTELMEKANAFEEAGTAEFDDFNDVVIEGARAGTWALTQTVGQLILDSDVGHKVAYYLASNPKEAGTVAKMKPLEQTKWFVRKETEFSADASAADGTETQQQSGSGRPAPKPPAGQSKTTPKAPPPPPNRARGGQGTTSVSADTTDFAAFEALNAGRTAH